MNIWPFTRRQAGAEPPLDPQAAYALWADHYPPHPHNRLMEIEQQAVVALLPPLDGRAALDAGCGSGRYLRELRDRGARVTGIDLSAAMLSRARAVSPRLVRADLRALPVAPASVDAIVCALALGDVPRLDAAVAELSRVLRPGGVLVYSVVHPVGARAGWSRIFDAAGRQRSIESHWHTSHAHRQACAAAGLRVTAWEEPVVPERPGVPAVLVVRATREA